ncbi:MAG: polysaccharide pyruvyl transferase family protein [Micrococcaceae bacterium]|nr:polysaccharide pyruvyl transferase family protein [Micrococcaceae bacterium]MDN5887136.1 polysaccharide pyruvyl transferase family protein [Micrococcaceae bacterium]
MSIVILGDVAITHLYHVGDEAMTEYAIDALRDRSIEDVVVVGNSKLVANRFGTSSVPRIGFDRTKSAAWRKARFDALMASAAGEEGGLPANDPAHKLIEAVRRSSGVLIAGGGNIASKFINHLTERFALAALARHFGVPLVLSSQTYGPELKPVHEKQVLEMMNGAALVGARERSSYELALSLGSDPKKTYRGVDDAFWLRPQSADRERVAELELPADYMLASFTEHAGSTGISRKNYYHRIAQSLDELVERFGMPVFLVSHVGSLDDPAVRSHDQLANDIIAGMTKSNRVSTLPMLTARQVVAVTEQARFNLSSRYHPAVFGAGAGVPSMCISLSLYSSVKLRGALKNVGMEEYAVQAASWTPARVVEGAERMLDEDSGLDEHMRRIVEIRCKEGKQWWDLVAEVLTGAPAPVEIESVSEAKAWENLPSWSTENRTVTDLVERTDRKLTEKGWALEHAKWKAWKFEKTVEQLESDLNTVRSERDAIANELTQTITENTSRKRRWRI